MQLGIKPYYKNSYPVGGILIKGSMVTGWLDEIYRMGLSLPGIAVYPIPGNTPNSTWGCLILTPGEPANIDTGKHNHCQVLNNKLFIPQNAVLYPRMAGEEIEKMLAGTKYILHPDFGLAALTEPINWAELLTIAGATSVQIQEPVTGIAIPCTINRFEVHSLPPDEILESLEQKMFPQTREFDDKPLSMLEKMKLGLYRALFKPAADKGAGGTGNTEKKSFFSKVEQIAGKLFKGADRMINKMLENYEELEKRNQKNVDKLLNLFKTNPDEALQYAIPLDENGSSRGGPHGEMDFSKRWFDLSLKSNYSTGSGGPGIIIPGDYLHQLRQHYLEAAQQLIKNGHFDKAAFIYMKLLKNYSMAAHTLETGTMYAEAAAIYLKYAKDRQKAAECYEKGSMYTQAIDMYKELGNDEKVGDLYTLVNQQDMAVKYYNKVAEGYTVSHQYVKAALVYKNKVRNIDEAQLTLLKGWRMGRDSLNCLGNYFSNVDDNKALEGEIENLYSNETNEYNIETFLIAIKYEYEKRPALPARVKDIAYEIIAERAVINPDIVAELKAFNKQDSIILKDIMRYKLERKNRNVGVGNILSGFTKKA